MREKQGTLVLSSFAYITVIMLGPDSSLISTVKDKAMQFGGVLGIRKSATKGAEAT